MEKPVPYCFLSCAGTSEAAVNTLIPRSLCTCAFLHGKFPEVKLLACKLHAFVMLIDVAKYRAMHPDVSVAQ